MRNDVLERCDDAGRGLLGPKGLRVQVSMVRFLARDGKHQELRVRELGQQNKDEQAMRPEPVVEMDLSD